MSKKVLNDEESLDFVIKRFKLFLKKYNLNDIFHDGFNRFKFKTDYSENIDTYLENECPYDYFSGSFSWSETEQGCEFWNYYSEMWEGKVSWFKDKFGVKIANDEF